MGMSEDHVRLLVQVRQGKSLAQGAHDDLVGELRAEMTSALGKAGRKLEAALAACEAAETEEAWRDARTRERRARWELKVHREALGLRNHAVLERVYPSPRR